MNHMAIRTCSDVTIRLAIVLVLMLVTSCSSTQQTGLPSKGNYLERAQTQEEGGIRVTVAVPGAAESKALFGTSLYRQGIQPVWLEIENNRGETVTFLPVGLDPAYYSPLEVANMDVKAKETRVSLINRKFFSTGLANSVQTGTKNSGFIFSKLDEGTKSFNVDVIGDTTLVTFTFFVPVPGLRVDHHTIDWQSIYPDEEVTEHSLEQFMEEMESTIADQKIGVAIIAVPGTDAQTVAAQLVELGIGGILNFAPVPLRVPGDVFVEDIDLTMALEKVSFFARAENKRE